MKNLKKLSRNDLKSLVGGKRLPGMPEEIIVQICVCQMVEMVVMDVHNMA